MNNFLTNKEKELLLDYVRPEVLEPCYKRLGKKDALPFFNRPTEIEIETLVKLTGLENNPLGVLIGVDRRKVSRWQTPADDWPTYSQWVLICLLAAKALADK